MRKIILTFALVCGTLAFAQNESSGSVATSITTPGPITGETFRFGPGLVTQLDLGSGFGFTGDRWFSMGRLNTGSQIVYGMRFQLPNRAIITGFQDLNDANPRIQWIGASSFAGSDLEFRTANSFTSTTSTLVATMTDRGNTFFGNPLGTTTTKVGIDYGDVGSTRTGLTVENISGPNAYIAKGIFSRNNLGGYIKTGIDIQSITGSCYSNTGTSLRISDGYLNTGITASVTGSENGATLGVSATIAGPLGVTPTGFGAAIQGSASFSTNRYAGYFDGNVFTTGMYLPSDERLKTNIKDEKNALRKLKELDVVTYNFKGNKHLNLPSELQHGFVAQNLEEVFPELLTTITKPIFDENAKEVGSNEFKAVNYIGMISILTSSLQELDEKSTARIQQVEEEASIKIAQLTDKIDVLEAQIAALTGDEETSNSQDADTVGFSMEQNKPNPFTNQTVINYTIPRNTKATISVVDLSGKFVKD
ncbi:MAG: tail fiber domain-containing protein, partial [Bacteroidota bacterium]